MPAPRSPDRRLSEMPAMKKISFLANSRIKSDLSDPAKSTDASPFNMNKINESDEFANNI